MSSTPTKPHSPNPPLKPPPTSSRRRKRTRPHHTHADFPIITEHIHLNLKAIPHSIYALPPTSNQRNRNVTESTKTIVSALARPAYSILGGIRMAYRSVSEGQVPLQGQGPVEGGGARGLGGKGRIEGQRMGMGLESAEGRNGRTDRELGSPRRSTKSNKKRKLNTSQSSLGTTLEERAGTGIHLTRSRIRLCSGQIQKGRICKPEISVETAIGSTTPYLHISKMSNAEVQPRSSSAPIDIPTQIATSAESREKSDSDWIYDRKHGRARSNSQPHTTHEFSSLSPLSAVLDRVGSEWLERLNDLRSDFDGSAHDIEENEVLPKEEQIPSDDHWADILVRDFAYERPSDNDGSDNSAVLDSDSIFSTSPPHPAHIIESPSRSEAYKNTFAVERGVGSHIFAILQRLREAEASNHASEETSTSKLHHQHHEATPSPDPVQTYEEVQDEWPSPSFTATESEDDFAWTESEHDSNNDSESEIMSLSSSVETYKYWR